MKKNIAMRVAAILFILTMISTCAFSTTFAKYVTSDTAVDSARVAKWGVTVAASTETQNKGLFASEYGATVKANENVVAPGTNGELACFIISGTPEVAGTITFESAFALYLDGQTTHNWVVEDDFYCPLVITVEGSTKTIISGLNYTSAADFTNAVDNAIKAVKYDFNPGDDLSALNNQITISWSWAFEGTMMLKIQN